eukprot:TRINITY_DN68972_c0_g1_i1.p1 TRINITY_DN68972_c0_g1~~TRINITY_DN68972_c0_g1_i1.p1  ORF type:complete len:639 (+),score=178.09 TRINITY_DN68972_c0_g1_i1:105-2021(+)
MVKRGSSRGGGKRVGGKTGKGGGSQLSGIEKYGYDDVDKALNLHEDKVAPSEDSDGFDDEQEEEVMGFEEDVKPQKRRQKKRRGAAEEEAEEEDEDGEGERDQEGNIASVSTSGWRGQDFYGGDDAGDEDSASDEDLVMEEARKLEELRAARLGGHSDDILGALIAPRSGTDDATDVAEADGKSGDAAARSTVGLTGAAANAQFESVFAGGAEHTSVERDLTQLSDGKKRAIMKKEAPELVPLLEDFQAKLSSLKQMLPLLAPVALKNIPASGVAFLEAKASLLLNTLANISFYLLTRAEGGSIRSHPVISQLVWLRSLHGKLGSIDKKLKQKMRKATKAAKKTIAEAAAKAEDGQTDEDKEGEDDEAEGSAPIPKLRPSLRERLDHLRKTLPVTAKIAKSAASLAQQPSGRRALATRDLLRLPTRKQGKRAGGGIGGDAPLDLEEADPSLGFRRIGSSLAEQMSSVQQLVRERTAKEKRVSADANVEARPRRQRDRPENFVPELAEAVAEAPEEKDDPEEDDIMKKARAAASAKKEKKSAREKSIQEARVARQFHPEEVIDGRRKTTKKILVNRGLVRERKQKAGNARVVNRGKYEKMVKRRRGAVQDMREGSADGATYEGEATGVRTNLKKSLKLG